MSMSIQVTGIWGNNKTIISGIHHSSHGMEIVLGEVALHEIFDEFTRQIHRGSSIQNIKEVRVTVTVYSVYSRIPPVKMNGTMFSGMGGRNTLNEVILRNIISQGLMCLEQARSAVIQSEYDFCRRCIG